MSDKLMTVRGEIAEHLEEIAKLFKHRPKITIVIRTDWMQNGDVILSDDKLDDIMAALQRLHAKPGIMIPSDSPAKACEHQHLKWADGAPLRQQCEDCGLMLED